MKNHEVNAQLSEILDKLNNGEISGEEAHTLMVPLNDIIHQHTNNLTNDGNGEHSTNALT